MLSVCSCQQGRVRNAAVEQVTNELHSALVENILQFKMSDSGCVKGCTLSTIWVSYSQALFDYISVHPGNIRRSHIYIYIYIFKE